MPLARDATNANPWASTPMNRSVMPDAVAIAPGIRHAVTRALDVQRQSLVWPVTASARGRTLRSERGDGVKNEAKGSKLAIDSEAKGSKLAIDSGEWS